MSNGPGTPPQLLALASQVWGCSDMASRCPGSAWWTPEGPGLCLPAPLTACQIAQLLQFGNGAAAISPHAVTKVSLTITHRVFQPKVMQRTDRGLMRVLFAP